MTELLHGQTLESGYKLGKNVVSVYTSVYCPSAAFCLLPRRFCPSNRVPAGYARPVGERGGRKTDQFVCIG